MGSRAGRWAVVGLVLACLLGATPAAPAAPAAKISDGTGPLDTTPDLEAALRFEKLIPEHTVGGMVSPLAFDKWPHIDRNAKVLHMDGEGDSGNYTGVYLAAQSWRYAQAKKELAKLGVAPLSKGAATSKAIAFWRKQRDEARARGRQMVAYYHVLVNIAEAWQTELDPHIDQERDPLRTGWLDFGGGIVRGEKGLLMRVCTPDKVNPAKRWGDVRVNGHDQRLIGPLLWKGKPWHCVGATSRDSYAGTLHGLSVALDFLADDANEDLRGTIANDLMAMTDYAAKYAWFQPRPHGEVAIPVVDNDLDGPVSPLFIQVALHRLHLLQNARHAARVIGDTAAARRYDLLWATEIANTSGTGALDLGILVDAARPHEAQYKYQLNLMSFFNLIRLERDPKVREVFKRALGVADASTTDDGNAFYEAITYGLTGEKQRRDEAVKYHREWLKYYAFHEEVARRGKTPFVHTGRCSITKDPGPKAPIEKRPLECVPMAQTYMTVSLPGGPEFETMFVPGGDSGEMRSRHPIPVRYRRYADFLWQKDPTKITGDHKTPWRGPSIDFLGTYWMLRYYSEVARPPVAPLPVWLGPRFS